jgi:hypothetical protein
LQTWYIGRARGWKVGQAPEDIELLEFALKWRVNPRELRESWTIRDMRWLELVEEARALAAPEIVRYQAEEAARKGKA